MRRETPADKASGAIRLVTTSMIVYDGIVFSLQRTGGISVLFKEIISRLPGASYRLVGFRDAPPTELPGASYEARVPRRFERYRRADFGAGADLFHSTYYRLPATRGAKVVTTVYDFVYERFASLPRRLVHSAQKRRALAGSDRIICISESTRRDLLEFMGHRYEDRAVVVPLAASEAFHALPDVERRPQVLFVGARGGYKNFTAVVEALSMLPDLWLICVGGGPLTAEERARLERSVPGRYRAAGYLSDADLNVEYNRSFCLTYPSLYEGFGIPVLEAMRAGCPVIAVNGSAIPEVAGEAALLLKSGHPDELRTAIARLTDSATRRDFIGLGTDRAAGFTWDETFRRTVALYEQLAGRPMSAWPWYG